MARRINYKHHVMSVRLLTMKKNKPMSVREFLQPIFSYSVLFAICTAGVGCDEKVIQRD